MGGAHLLMANFGFNNGSGIVSLVYRWVNYFLGFRMD